jgi:hypothetical protein
MIQDSKAMLESVKDMSISETLAGFVPESA